jgi:hypothetical protein
MIKRDLNQPYLVAPHVMAQRITDETLQTHLSLKWQFVSPLPPLNGNLLIHLQYSLSKKAFEWVEHPTLDLNAPFTVEVISASLLLYRLMCVFYEPPLVPKRAYKTLWEYPLLHVATGHVLGLMDYKAGISMVTAFDDLSEMPDDFAKDALELLNFLVSEQVAHPYDGVLAGSIA